MVNQRREAVSYRPFRVAPVLSEGLLGVARDDGEFERKAAAGFARMAEQFGQKADRDAERRMTAAGEAKSAEINVSPTVVDGGQSVSPKEANERAARARQYLMEKHGLNAAQASAFAGHGMQESGFNTTAVGDKGSAFGIMQWRGDRRAALNSFAQSNGRDVNDLYTQLDFAMQELRGTERRAGEKLFAARDVRSAVTALMDYERPAGWAPDRPTAGHGFDNRLAFALGFDPADAQSARKPMSVSSVAGEKPQLTGRDTIGGRAYDAALMKGYKQKLELAMLQDQDAVYEAYKDDPAMLEKAMGELLEAHRRDHLMPEIEAEYAIGFERRAYAKVREARQEQERRIQAEDRMAFIGRVEEMENAKSRALAGLDPNSDTAEAELASLQGTIDDHYDTAVARGVLTPAEAEKAKQDSRSDMLTGFYTKQAATMTADQIRSMRADMTRDFADGTLEGVSGDDWSRIESGLIAAEKARETQDAKADADLKKRGDDLAKRVSKGLPVTPEEVARFQLDAGTAPNGAKISASTLSLMRVSEAIRTLPIGEVEKRLPALIGDQASPDDIDAARALVASHRKDVAADPIGVAERFGVLPVSPGLPLDEGADADSVSMAFSERINQARVAARHFGVSPRYFRPGEAEAIEAAVTRDPANGLAIAAGLVDAAGRDADRVLGELGETAPAVAGAGEIVAAGGDPRAARDLLAGHGKTPDGKAYPDRAITKRIPQARAIAGEALAFAPDQINRLDEQAAAITRKRLYDAGIDPKSEEAKPVYERAFQEAAGATYAGSVRFGGFAPYDPGIRWKERPVLVPPSIRADKFGEVIGALEDGDIGTVKAKNGKAWTAADFKRAMPVAVAGGYVFALGDPTSASPMFIADEKGDPLVLDVANMAGLKARVPEAFR